MSNSPLAQPILFIFIENKNNLFRNSFFINLKPFFLKEYYFLVFGKSLGCNFSSC